MKKFEVVSIDMFRTLADVDDSLTRVRWQKLLKENYTPELGRECQGILDASAAEHFPRDMFVLQKEVLNLCLADLLSKVSCEFSRSEAIRLTVDLHAFGELFGDAIPFLNAVGKKYPICLAADADEDLLGTRRDIYAFDRVFTSEQLHTYKGYADGRFFFAIIKHYGVRPEHIIHIGDDRNEIIGADKAGITTCWLNRNGRKWSDDVKPDYEIKSLTEAAAFLLTPLLGERVR